jgi:DNA-binding beta-propeller fold protein YncE
MNTRFAFTALLFASACANQETSEPQLSKDEVRELAGKGDQSGPDYCKIYDWYGDGICDDFCKNPDPDCAESCAATPSADEILVAVEDGGAATVNAKTGAARKKFSTGPNAFGALYSRDGVRAFVTDKNTGMLSEIDRTTGTVLSSINVGVTPQQPAITSSGRIYIPLSTGGAIAVVEAGTTKGAAMSLARTIPAGTGSKPHIVSMSPDQKTLWVTVQGADPRVMSIELTTSGEGAIKDYRYDIVPRVVDAANNGAWFTGHHSTGMHKVDLATGVVSTPYMDEFGASSEAKKQIEGAATSANGNLVAITHEGRKALVVFEMSGTKANKLLDVDNLSATPYWASLDPNGQVAYVSIPGSGTVQAYGIGDGCGSTPLWTANVGGKVKRMAVRK